MSVFTNGAKWLRGVFTGSLDWITTANRSIQLPDDSGTIQLQDRAIGALNSGVVLRGYETLATVTLATKTLTLSDAGTVQDCRGTANQVITIPLNSSVSYPIGTRIIIRRTTSFNVFIAGISGTTLLNERNETASPYAVQTFVIIRKTATDTWVLDSPTTSFVGVEANRTTNQSILNNGQLTTLIFDQVQDASTGYNQSTGIFTVPPGCGGMFRFTVSMGFSQPSNNAQFYALKNNVLQQPTRSTTILYPSDCLYTLSHTSTIRLLAGDTFAIQVYYNSLSGAVVTSSMSNPPTLQLVRFRQ